ncbi:MAG TPA: glycosyltransferase [Polyangiaceae bacterium]|nr:glycosyltransferase [Polyangiaceae bacterium]
MSRPLQLVILGLSITSSWGNGHATTYRALVRGLAELGHRVSFLERDMPWYAENRDEHNPEGCTVALYSSIGELEEQHRDMVRNADAVIIGSYVPDGQEVMDWVLSTARGLTLFYDIDTPVTLERLRRGEATYLNRDSVRRLDAYLSFSGGPVLHQIESELGARLALPLYCSVDAARYVPTGDQPARDFGYLGTYSADRQPTLDRLLTEPARHWSEGRFVVAGPCYPQTEWPDNVQRIEHIAPGDHPSFYCSLRFTLNVTRADMIQRGYSPSVRLFEAAACGVPIISDAWSGLEEFFTPGSEILLPRSGPDVLKILRGMPESERREIGQRARHRVLNRHTSLHRALELEHYVTELQAGRTRGLRSWSVDSGASAPAAIVARRAAELPGAARAHNPSPSQISGARLGDT